MNKDTFFGQKRTLNLKGTLLTLDKTHIMGIINVNNDSFYAQSSLENEDEILNKVHQFAQEGATFVDLGASSSRPGAMLKSSSQECDILVPLVEKISQSFPHMYLSIDTVYAQVAKFCVQAGAHLINDISAGSIDDQLWSTVAKLNVPYVLMHMQGVPQNMQNHTLYPDGIVKTLYQFFDEKLKKLYAIGVNDVLIDLGFGFGKTLEHNYELFRNQQIFDYFGCPQLLGISRKSMVYKALKTNEKEALIGSTALHTIAATQGAKILRVHDVKAAVDAVQMVQWVNKEYEDE